MLKAVLSAPSAPLPGTSLYYISLSLWFGDINTEIQMTMQRSSVGQSTHLSLAAADKGSILIQDNCWLSTGDQTSRLHISTDLLFPSLNWTHFDFGWAPAVSWKKWHSADKGHPYPWSVSALLIVECNRSCFLLLFLFRNLSRERLMYSSNKAPPKTFLTALQWTAFHVKLPAAAIFCRCCSSSAVSSAAYAKLVCWPNQWQRHISGRKTRRTTVVMLLSLSDPPTMITKWS